ncbi:MAG TPA: 8-amino-7-oxononanoate synthase [Verrucomicrobiae bacterium]|nr:8-amino-7-oxononanoate synthase [Verrucomicrobiae bacterium]
MTPLDAELSQRLKAIRSEGLYRELRKINSPQGTHVVVDGKRLLNFSSNDYLGLANHPSLKSAVTEAVQKYGVGAGSARLICGSLKVHHELERTLAEFKGTEAALTFSSGYATAVGTICALMEKEDVVIIDRLVHACLVDGAKLSGAKLRVFAHNDVDELKDILEWAREKNARRILIVTESVFSMDGDLAPLREIVELKERYGAWLMLDEAHATGLFGAKRRGLAEAFELAERLDIQMGTLGKALGSAGGYICGSRALIDYLINHARTFMFSTAPVPPAAAAARAAIEMVRSPEGEALRTCLWARVDQVKNGLIGTPWKIPIVQSPIIPLMIGDEQRAMEAAAQLRTKGVLIPAVRYPTVARGKARLRLTVSAAHTPEDMDEFLHASTRET